MTDLPPPPQPEIVDNQHGNSHVAALKILLAEKPDEPVAIATGYVNLGGLHQLATVVNDQRGLRLLIGAQPDPALGARLPLDTFQVAVESLRAERDIARFPPSRLASQLGDISDWLDNPHIEVRRYVGRFLHGKAYLLGTAALGRVAMVTSANLTGAGLNSNLELGMVHYQPSYARAAITWFDQLWDASADFTSDLRSLLFPDPGLIDPQTVYQRALLELYGHELAPDAADHPIGSVQLADFQRQGFERALAIVERHHGVIYADGVGTGKTEIGLAFIEEYAVRRGHTALVIAPAQLKENWESRISEARLPAQVISFHQLASDEQLSGEQGNARRHLHNLRDTYRLVVIDEAHAFRNPDNSWYRALERLLGGERKDLVMLTATPINNGLWDLYHLVMTFARHDRALASIGIPSLRDVFVAAGANERDPGHLSPEVLFPVADAVSVRHDRRFIEEHFPDATFADGTPVRFPTPHMTTKRYDLDAAHPNLVVDVATLIGELKMARYQPSGYLLDGDEDATEHTLAGLLLSGILKRFESCWWACLNTVDRMVEVHRVFLTAWDSGSVPSKAVLREAAKAVLGDTDVGGWLEAALEADPESLPVSAYNPAYRSDVADDLAFLERIDQLLRLLDAASDPKLALLRNLLATSPADKVAVFATFGDTARYLDDNLAPGDVGGQERVVIIGADTDPDSRANLLGRFCPESVVRPGYQPPDGEADLLISTDVVSEGQNLQQAQAVISYDMPWNPQRVVQRNGRVIRLKSPHDDVYLTTMLPEEGDLELVLQLETAIRRKLKAAAVYGMESPVLEEVIDAELHSYADRLTSGDTSLLAEDNEPAHTGAFSGERLRADLLRAVAEGSIDRLRALPWGIGAGFRQGPTIPSFGDPGVFFACRTKCGYRYWRFVEADLTPVANDADLLARIEPGDAPALPVEDMSLNLEEAWSVAAGSIVEEHNRRADPRTDDDSVGPMQRFALDLLRDPEIPIVSGMDEAELALSVERGQGVRQSISRIHAAVLDDQISRSTAAQQLVQVVRDFGLREVEAPLQLDPITADEVGVVCWMIVRPQAAASASPTTST